MKGRSGLSWVQGETIPERKIAGGSSFNIKTKPALRKSLKRRLQGEKPTGYFRESSRDKKNRAREGGLKEAKKVERKIAESITKSINKKEIKVVRDIKFLMDNPSGVGVIPGRVIKVSQGGTS